jgi:hypothetical protein
MSQAASHSPGCYPDRRRFLISLAAFGASMALPLASSLAQAPAKPRLIDVHHHIIPSFFVDAWKDRGSQSPASFRWSPQKARGEMDQSGVAHSDRLVLATGGAYGNRGTNARRVSPWRPPVGDGLRPRSLIRRTAIRHLRHLDRRPSSSRRSHRP